MKVRIGDMVSRSPVTIGGESDLRGKVVYVHPNNRYHTVEFNFFGGAIRECFRGVER